MIKFALFAGLGAVLVFIALGIRYARRMDAGRTREQILDREAVELYRRADPEQADIDAEQLDLDARWSAYWGAQDAAYASSPLRAWLLRAEDPPEVLEAALREFAERVIEQFVIDAVRLQRDRGNEMGGWRNDTEREADRWYRMANGDLSAMKHLVEIDITDTGSWSAADEAALREHMAADAGAGRGARR